MSAFPLLFTFKLYLRPPLREASRDVIIGVSSYHAGRGTDHYIFRVFSKDLFQLWYVLAPITYRI